jgi:single-strand DNA-binding protein
VLTPTISFAGHVGQDPTLRTTASGVLVTDLRVAVTPRRRDKDGEWADTPTLWFKVTAWRRLGEHVAGSVKKGDRVVVSGDLGLEKWLGNDGVEREGLVVTAETVGLDLSRGTAVYTKAPRPAFGEPVPDGVDGDTGEMDASAVAAFEEREEEAA